MELLGVLECLRYFVNPEQITIYSDSQYVVSSINNKHLTKWVEDNDQSNASHRCFLPVFLFLWVFVGRFPCTQYSSAARKIHIEKQQIFSDFLLKITSSSRVSKSRDTCGTQVSLLRSVSIEAGDHALFLSFYPCSISSSGGIARSFAPS